MPGNFHGGDMFFPRQKVLESKNYVPLRVFLKTGKNGVCYIPTSETD